MDVDEYRLVPDGDRSDGGRATPRRIPITATRRVFESARQLCRGTVDRQKVGAVGTDEQRRIGRAKAVQASVRYGHSGLPGSSCRLAKNCVLVRNRPPNAGGSERDIRDFSVLQVGSPG